jgi:DNA-directed RNA polymerase subunit RPC12/RpoP
MVLMKEIFSSWAGSNYMDNLHAKAGIACTQCHGKGLPKPDDTVENGRCLTCHGPMDKLAQKTEPKDFKDRNPHKSHLGEIACTVCHKGHGESKVYCLDCHRNFKMKIQGGAKQ